MPTIGTLTKQTIDDIVANQDILINITCYETDGVTLRTMTGATYLLEWYAKSTDNSVEITKTSAAGEIVFGTPDANSVQVEIGNTEIQVAKSYQWALRGTDAAGDNEFTAAVGVMGVVLWP